MEDYKDVHIKIFLKAGLIGDWMGWKDVSFFSSSRNFRDENK